MKKLIFITALTLIFIAAQAQSVSNQNEMYFTTQVEGSISEVFEKVKVALKAEKFGVVTELDMDKTLHKKLGVEMMPYKIVGICSAKHANQVLQYEENIGVFLPCKMILKQIEDHTVEVVALNPEVVMGVLQNPEITEIGEEVGASIKRVIQELGK